MAGPLAVCCATWGVPGHKEGSAVTKQVTLPPNGQYVDVPFSPADDPWVTEAGVPLPGASLRIYAFYTTPETTSGDATPDTTAPPPLPRRRTLPPQTPSTGQSSSSSTLSRAMATPPSGGKDSLVPVLASIQTVTSSFARMSLEVAMEARAHRRSALMEHRGGPGSQPCRCGTWSTPNTAR